ncbi:MAG: hypothetical protein ACHREM_23760 [Polyangiales bacterium]
MPKEVWVFVAPDKPYVLAKTTDDDRFVLPDEGMDPDAILAVFKGDSSWDGGDW